MSIFKSKKYVFDEDSLSKVIPPSKNIPLAPTSFKIPKVYGVPKTKPQN